MTSKRISLLPSLPLTPALDGTEVVVANKGGVTYRTTVAALIANQITTANQAAIDEMEDIRAVTAAESATALLQMQTLIINFNATH